MEEAVNGIREQFYHRLIHAYVAKREKSFLYRYFWAEEIQELLETLEKHPEQVWNLLRAGSKKKRHLWEELSLNDAGYAAGLISDTDYYLWLVKYLAAHSICYKDCSIRDGHTWLNPLLNAGLQSGADTVRTKTQTGRDLNRLAEQIRTDRDAIAGRLHNLRTAGDGGVPVDYLPWLTERLSRIEIHIKIKYWLQNSGYSAARINALLAGEEWSPPKKNKTKKSARKSRKASLMRMFETYCDDDEGFYVLPKDQAPKTQTAENWRIDTWGFCTLNAEQIGTLLNTLEQNKKMNFYLPLAMDLYSGCVFFLAKKEYYEELYRQRGLMKEYRNTNVRYCFDYLRLDEAYLKQFPENVGGAFRLQPTLHKNAGRTYTSALDAYKAILGDFQRYCITGLDGDGSFHKSPRQIIKRLNEKWPASTPEAFRWAFHGPESWDESEVSQDAEVSFREIRERRD